MTPGFLPTPDQNVWQWAEKHVDFSRAANYDTPLKGPYDPDFLPYWKPVAEWITDNSVKEIIVLKSSRAGASENLLLNAIRYAVGCRPQPTLYVTGDQASAERMMHNRIKRSMSCADSTRKAYRAARATEHEIQFPGMDFRVTWPKSKQAFKQDGWALILCDELSTWPEWSMSMARRRTSSYPFAHIVAISSPDPNQRRGSEDDPIFAEYEQGDQCKWMMPDPGAKGERFVFEMGTPSSAWGVKWDPAAKREDETWDYDLVERTAHYITPGGHRIEESDRMNYVRKGELVPTNPNAKKGVRSVHINALYTPFSDCTFGAVATAFLKAKAAGPIHLRSWVYEYMAEKWQDDVPDFIKDEEIYACERHYERGESFTTAPDLAEEYQGDEVARVLTVDVQKDHVWWLVSEIASISGDVGIIDFGRAEIKVGDKWDKLAEVSERYAPAQAFIDAGYAGRRLEVWDVCASSPTESVIPCIGRANIRKPVESSWIDPYEGARFSRRAYKGGKIRELQWNPDEFKPKAQDSLVGVGSLRAHLFKDPPRELIKQLIAEEFVGGKWQLRRGHRENHLWDCLVMAFMASWYWRNQT